LDTILEDNLCKKVWLEKRWYYKRWGNIEISNEDYTLIMEIQGTVNNLNYSLFNQKWLIELIDTDKLQSSFYCTRNEDKYLLVCSIKQNVKLDTLTFNVGTLQSPEKKGQIQFIRLCK
jgi:hypothetical protein